MPPGACSVRIEEQADQLHDQGRKELFRNQNNAIAFVIGTEVYDHLEEVVDRFEDVASEISAIVIERQGVDCLLHAKLAAISQPAHQPRQSHPRLFLGEAQAKLSHDRQPDRSNAGLHYA